MWLGRLWASPTHLVYDLADKCIREVRAVLRVPLPERWDREALQSVDAWPRRLEPAPEAGEAQVVPGPIPAADVPPPEVPPPPARRDPLPPLHSEGGLGALRLLRRVRQVRAHSGRPAGCRVQALGCLPAAH